MRTTSCAARSSAQASRAGSFVRAAELLDAERVPLGISHDRPRALVVGLRLDDGRARGSEPLDLRLTVVRPEVEMDGIRLRPRSLAALEEVARPASVRIVRRIESGELPPVDSCIAELLQEGVVDPLVRPAERVRPEASELNGFGAGERDVADGASSGARRRLEAESVSLGVAHDGPGLQQPGQAA